MRGYSWSRYPGGCSVWNLPDIMRIPAQIKPPKQMNALAYMAKVLPGPGMQPVTLHQRPVYIRQKSFDHRVSEPLDADFTRQHITLDAMDLQTLSDQLTIPGVPCHRPTVINRSSVTSRSAVPCILSSIMRRRRAPRSWHHPYGRQRRNVRRIDVHPVAGRVSWKSAPTPTTLNASSMPRNRPLRLRALSFSLARSVLIGCGISSPPSKDLAQARQPSGLPFPIFKRERPT